MNEILRKGFVNIVEFTGKEFKIKIEIGLEFKKKRKYNNLIWILEWWYLYKSVVNSKQSRSAVAEKVATQWWLFDNNSI